MPPARRRLDRAVVVRTSVALVDDGGLAALSLSAVAAQLGVRPSALYTHIEGSEHLHQIVAVDTAICLADVVRRAAVGVAGDDAVRQVARAYRQFALDHPGRYEALIAPPGEGFDLDAAMAEIEEVLVSVLGASGVSAERRAGLATSMRSLLHGFAALEASEAHAVDPEHFETVVELAVRGLS